MGPASLRGSSYQGLDMSKFHVVMRTKKVGLPHDLKIETTAESEALAKSHALYYLRKHGHSAFNVPPRTFAPHVREFKRFHDGYKDDAIVMASPDDEVWIKALDLRNYINPRT